MSPLKLKKYFAYGSNLLDGELTQSKVEFTPGGRASLSGYKLAFTRYSSNRGGGVADIVPESNEVVWGFVYDIGGDTLPKLDNKEGVTTGAYQRVCVDVHLDDGRKLRCLSYTVVTKTQPDIPPSKKYLDLIIKGAKEKQLPKPWIDWVTAIPSKDSN